MNLATLPKARFKADSDTIRKAAAMIQRGKSDEYISDYLGMAAVQVAEIRRRAPAGVRGRPPAIVPTKHREAVAYAQQRAPIAPRHDTETAAGDAKFRRALYAYGAKHGLPNLTHLQCISELKTLCMVREEELALADRIEAELARPSMLKECEE